MQTLAELLATSRSDAGLTQSELAQRVGVSRHTIGRWERGTNHPSRDVLSTIATVLGIEAETLLIAAGHPPMLRAGSGISQPVRPLLGALPFSQLTPDRFELACISVMDHRHPGGHTARYGGSGEEQYGIDLLTTIDGVRYATGQCKRHKTFGAAAIREAITKVSEPATINYLFLAREVATTDARDEIENHLGWELWDGETLSRYVREKMSDDDSTRFVDTFFPSYRKDFLGKELPGPWQTISEFYTPASGDQAFTHDWELVGRENEAAMLDQAIRAESPAVSVAFGRGGIGKSRLLLSVAEIFATEGWFVRILGRDAVLDGQSYEAIPSTGAVLIVVDDVHDRNNCGAVVAGVLARNPRAKILIASRPYGTVELDRALRPTGLLLSDLPTVTLGDLPLAAAVELATAALGPESEIHADRLAALTRDCPLATVVGGYLIRAGKLDHTGLEQDDRVRETILLGFRDALFAAGDRERRRTVLEAVSILQPFRSDEPEFQSAIATLVGTTYKNVSYQLRELEDSGILLRRNTSIRIVPDLLADVVLADACFDRRSGVDNGYLPEVLAATSGAARVHVFLNVSRVDWQVEHRMSDAVNRCWDFIQDSLQDNSISTYMQALKSVNQVAAMQPKHALALVQWVLDHPVDDETGAREHSWFGWRWQHVLNEVATTARLVSYTKETRRGAYNLLWSMAQNAHHNSADPQSNNPLTILKEISQFGLEKPLGVNQDMIELAESWAEHETSLSPLKVIEPLVATEGESHRYRGYTLTLTGFAIDPDGIRAIRRRAIGLAVKEICGRDLSRAIVGTWFVGLALQYPNGLIGREVTDEEKARWHSDFVDTIVQLQGVLQSIHLDPLVSLGVFEGLSWHANYGSGPVHDAAERACESLPDTLAFWFALWLSDGRWARLYRKPGMDWQESQRGRAAAVAHTAQRAITELDDEAIIDLLEDRVQAQRNALDRRISPRNNLIEALLTRRPTLAKTLLERVLVVPASSLDVFVAGVVNLVGQIQPGGLMAITRRLLDSDISMVRTQAAIGLAGRDRRTEPLLDGELDLLHEFAVESDADVRGAVAEAAFSLAETHPNHASDLLVRVPFADSPRLAQTILDGLEIYGLLTWPSLSSQQQAVIWDGIRKLNDLDDYSIQHFLRLRSAEDPAAVLELLRQRIERSELTSTSNRYKPVPHSWSESLAVREHPSFIQQLRELLSWLKDRTSPLPARQGSSLFAAAAVGFDEPVLALLQQTLQLGTDLDTQVVCLALQEAPDDLVFREVDFVIDALTALSARSAKQLGWIQDALGQSALTGTRHGVPGEPYPQDIRLRDECAGIAEQLVDAAPVAATFYRKLSERGADAVNRYRDHEPDPRPW
ncbi:helix-turn-helix domain-containing protein [Nocardia fluminea]|uniref:helix-turn-helix domain-containing protein n=1 Tax=Nocardia fluminea TaxID=134984 RepID=UPI0033DAAE5B